MSVEFIPKYWEIEGPDQSFYRAAKARLQHTVVSPDEMGVMTDLAPWLAMIQRTEAPEINKPTAVIFAADHGLISEGGNDDDMPSTKDLFLEMIKGNSSAHASARAMSADIELVDAGIVGDLFESEDGESELAEGWHDAKIAEGTSNSIRGAAMGMSQINEAFAFAERLVDDLYQSGCNTIIPTGMGVGSASSAALIAANLSNIEVDRFIDQDIGGDDMVHYRKRTILRKAIERITDQRGLSLDPLNLLGEYGGFEIAMITGAMLSAAERGMVVVIDGFISTAAFQLARALNQNVLYYCIASQRQKGHAHQVLLQKLSATPLITLGLAHSPAVGGLLSLSVIRSAAELLKVDVAPFLADKIAEEEAMAARMTGEKHAAAESDVSVAADEVSSEAQPPSGLQKQSTD